MSEVMNAAPPYVSFEWRAVEDRNASIEAGHYVARDVAYALITPAGSRDTTERVAEQWLKQIESGDYPASWIEAFRYKYNEWKNSGKLIETGTPIKNWCMATPAQIENCLHANIHTLEQLAELNEEGIMRLGMGGRLLKERAADYLKASKDTGRIAEEISKLKAEISALRGQNTKLTNQLKALQAKDKDEPTGNNK